MLEEADETASSRRARHEQLHLITYRRLSHQADMTID